MGKMFVSLAVAYSVLQIYTRGRYELFRTVSTLLIDMYRAIAAELLRGDLPLLIVDKAHNCKIGPADGTHGYARLRRSIASRIHRMFLLTAAPFQLHP
jgi:hypothetical protein